MCNNTSTGGVKNLLFIILTTLSFLFTPALNAYNNAWSDNEDYVVPNQTNVNPGEGDENQELEGSGMCPVRKSSPVYTESGHFTWSSTDIVLPGKSGIYFSRSYTSKEPLSGLFGNGWISNLESGFIETVKHINDDGSQETHYIYRKEDGLRYTFKDINGTFETPRGMYHKIETLSETSYKVTYPDNGIEIYSNDMIISKEDVYGNKREYVYDENSLLQSIKDSNNNTLSFTFGANGYVTAITDQTGRTWRYDYDEDGNLISVTDPLNGKKNYFYEKYQADNDAQFYFHLTKITDETDVVIVEVEYEKDITGTYAYKNGRVKSYTEGEDTFTYNWDYLLSYKYVNKTNSLNHRYRFDISDSGHVTKSTDPYSKAVEYSVDENMSIKGITDKNSKIWGQSLDEKGRIISTTTPLGSTTVYAYDTDNKEPSTVTSPLGHVTKISYDENKNPTTVTLPDNSTYKYSYDEKGNILDTTNRSGVKSKTVTYDSNSQPLSIKNASGDTVTFSYNTVGEAATITDAKGNSATYTYDLLGHLTKTVNAMGHEIAYTYDKAGRLLTIKDPAGNTTSYEYDTFGRVSKITRANGRTLEYSYDTANRLTNIKDSAGKDTAFTYDSVGNVTKITSGSYYIQYWYDSTGKITQGYNSESAKYVHFTYNADGQLTQEKQDYQTVDYTYDLDGNLATMSAKGTTFTYNRNSLGDLLFISDATDTIGFEYDLNGVRKSITYPNGMKMSYDIDDSSRLVSLDNGITKNSYVYDKNGMLTQKTVDAAVTDYAYDKAGRLTQAGADNYSYSTAGNMQNNTAVYDTATNQLSSTDTHLYEYDTFGNLVKKTEKTTGNYKVYAWTTWNQLSSVESFTSAAVSTKKISFKYGPLGKRLSKTVDGVTDTYLYSGQNLIAIMDNYKNIKYRILHDETIDSPLSIVDVANTKKYYYHKDHLGSVVGLSDGSKNIVESYSYDAYGQSVKTSTAVTGNPFAYTSREMDDDDLYYYRARYYDPTVGRFLSEDSLKFDSGDYNWYRYVLNNPMNYLDPYGNKGFWSGAWEVVQTGGKIIVVGATIIGGALILTAKGVGTVTILGMSTPALVISTVVVGGVLTIKGLYDMGQSMKKMNEQKDRFLELQDKDCRTEAEEKEYQELRSLDFIKKFMGENVGRTTFAPPGM